MGLRLSDFVFWGFPWFCLKNWWISKMFQGFFLGFPLGYFSAFGLSQSKCTGVLAGSERSVMKTTFFKEALLDLT